MIVFTAQNKTATLLVTSSSPLLVPQQGERRSILPVYTTYRKTSNKRRVSK